MTTGDAKSLIGRIIHLSTTTAGRVGKGVLNHINARASETAPPWSDDLEDNCDFLEELLMMQVPRTSSLLRNAKEGVRF